MSTPVNVLFCPECIIGWQYASEMPHTLARILIRCVFSTKGRRPFIVEPEILWKHLGVIAKSKNVTLVTAGGTTNHVHLLLALSSMMTVAKVIQDLKALSSRWIKEDVAGFTWQEGQGSAWRERITTGKRGGLDRTSGLAPSEVNVRAGVFGTGPQSVY